MACSRDRACVSARRSCQSKGTDLPGNLYAMGEESIWPYRSVDAAFWVPTGPCQRRRWRCAEGISSASSILTINSRLHHVGVWEDQPASCSMSHPPGILLGHEMSDSLGPNQLGESRGRLGAVSLCTISSGVLSRCMGTCFSLFDRRSIPPVFPGPSLFIPAQWSFLIAQTAHHLPLDRSGRRLGAVRRRNIPGAPFVG